MTTATTQQPMTGQPWDRQPGEGVQAFAAWRAFLALGDARSVRAVARKVHKNVTLMGRWSSKHRWQERLTSWLAHQAKVQQDALDHEARGRAKLWADREQEAREEQFKLGKEMIAKAREIMALPIKRKVTRGRGKKATVVVEPVNCNVGHASRMSEVGQKMVNLSVGAATDRTALVGKDGESVVAGSGAATIVVYIPAKDKDQKAATLPPMPTPPPTPPEPAKQ